MPFTALSALLALALLALDQWVKRYIALTLPLGETRPLLPGLVELKTVHNYGAAWSSFSGARWSWPCWPCWSGGWSGIPWGCWRAALSFPAVWGTSWTGCVWAM